MVLLDGTITIVALPAIGADLRFSQQGLQWVLSVYALTYGGLLLLGRPGGRPARAPPRVPGRRRGLHGRLARVRARLDAGG